MISRRSILNLLGISTAAAVLPGVPVDPADEILTPANLAQLTANPIFQDGDLMYDGVIIRCYREDTDELIEFHQA